MFIASYQQHISDFGDMHIRPLTDQDAGQVWQWAVQPYAKFWGMQEYSQSQFVSFYAEFSEHAHKRAYLVLKNNQPVALVELYNPSHDPVGQTYAVAPQDIGMHILLCPNQRPQPNFSFQVMRCVLTALFSHRRTARIVVEPDCNNHKIHQLNKRLGFVHTQRIDIAGKQAYLGFCDYPGFSQALDVFCRLQEARRRQQYVDATGHLTPTHWEAANRDLVVKAITEFVHERLLQPDNLTARTYALRGETVHYEFEADWLALDHLVINPASVVKYDKQHHQCALDACDFIGDFAPQLGLEGLALATYLEELQSTLAAACYKRALPSPGAAELAYADFQTLEGAMTEGHPVFIANNGRIGFGIDDYQHFAPEVSKPVKLLWIAVHHSVTVFAGDSQYPDYTGLIAQELDVTLRDRFTEQLQQAGVNSEQYYWMPVHPWQWQNKLNPVFAGELATGKMVYLGEGDDYYLPQQSIRTFYNMSHRHKHYVKVALSIQNMGFMRGLSAGYMKVTPAINRWAYDVVTSDPTLQSCGFTLLKEHSTLGYHHRLFEREVVGDTPYKKILACLWRENPTAQLTGSEQLMTMAGLLHVDYQGNSLLGQLIDRAGVGPQAWLDAYLKVYFVPLLHCFYAHDLVFMPHGENLILALTEGLPTRAFMKDIGEEVALLNSHQQVPDAVARIHVAMPEDKALLSIFTDVFDCFFRYMAAILHREKRLGEAQFWHQVGAVATHYQRTHPQLEEQFIRHNLFAPDFAHSCLNRLQLGNSKQMVNLADPAGSLKFAGRLDNPLAMYPYPTFGSDKRALAAV